MFWIEFRLMSNKLAAILFSSVKAFLQSFVRFLIGYHFRSKQLLAILLFPAEVFFLLKKRLLFDTWISDSLEYVVLCKCFFEIKKQNAI